jgi:hypothetical protein
MMVIIIMKMGAIVTVKLKIIKSVGMDSSKLEKVVMMGIKWIMMGAAICVKLKKIESVMETHLVFVK